MANATVKGDYLTLIKYVYPKIIAKRGGVDSMTRLTKVTFEKIKKEGVTLSGAKMGRPGEIKLFGSKQFCIIPQQIFVKMNDKTISATSSNLAISEDNGQHWYFIALQDKGNPEVDEFFPELKGWLTFPKTVRQVIVER
ncbi:MAG: hypothetical protein ABIN13_08665 [Mucilaginibacter sp.]